MDIASCRLDTQGRTGLDILRHAIRGSCWSWIAGDVDEGRKATGVVGIAGPSLGGKQEAANQECSTDSSSARPPEISTSTPGLVQKPGLHLRYSKQQAASRIVTRRATSQGLSLPKQVLRKFHGLDASAAAKIHTLHARIWHGYP